jgi:hypothetical protein
VAFHGGVVIQLAVTVRAFNLANAAGGMRACTYCSHMFDAIFGDAKQPLQERGVNVFHAPVAAVALFLGSRC